MLGLLWYGSTIAGALVFLLASVYPRFTVAECVLASVPVGTLFGAWATLVAACVFGEIR